MAMDNSAAVLAEDRWIVHRMTEATRTATTALDAFDYAAARQAADDLLWDFADDWLELAKHRIWFAELHGSEAVDAARLTMTLVLRRLLMLYAPFLPFVTDELYATLYGPTEGVASIHCTRWPAIQDELPTVDEVEPVLAVLRTVRSIRTERRIPQSQEVERLIVNCSETLGPTVRAVEMSLLADSRARQVAYGQADRPTGDGGLSVELIVIDP